MDTSSAVDILKDLKLRADTARDEQAARRRKESDERVKTRLPIVAGIMADRGYVFTPETLKVLECYMRGENIILGGDVGTGKSFFFYVLGMPALNMTMASSRTIPEINAALEAWSRKDILIDDFGAETDKFSSFGTAMNLSAYILERRIDSPARTHITTNLSPEQLARRYDSRVLDRLGGLGRYHLLKGASRRDPDAVKRRDMWFGPFWKGPVWKECAKKCSHYDCFSHKCTMKVISEPSSCERCVWF